VDASAWNAFFNRTDNEHPQVARLMKSLFESRIAVVTSDYILDETLTLLRFKGGHRVAVRAGRAIQTAAWVTLVDVGRDVRADAWKLFEKMGAQAFSFTDCTSFSLMRRLGIGLAFTLDADFERAGFTRLSSVHLQ
jgi:hypothetical protein